MPRQRPVRVNGWATTLVLDVQEQAALDEAVGTDRTAPQYHEIGRMLDARAVRPHRKRGMHSGDIVGKPQ
jgi:hypothetical protein